jgi:chemotaxis protein MotB
VREILGGTVDDKGKGNSQMKGPGGARKGEKGEQEPVAKAPVPPPVAELLPSMQYLTRELQNEIKSGKVQMRLEARGLIISLREAAFFASGDDAITASSLSSIGKMATVLRDLPNPVRLEGHTDSVPIHTARFRNNWELSASRSIAMLELLTTRFEVPAGRFAVAGYADTVPLASNDTEEGRAHNRRVDIVILNRSTVIPDSGPKTAMPGGGKTGAAKRG